MATTTQAVTATHSKAAKRASMSAGANAVKIREWSFLIGPPIVILALLIGAWYGTSAAMGEKAAIVLPNPSAVISEFATNSDYRAELLSALVQSTLVASLGLVIAAVLGIGWAVAMSMAKWVERSLYPYAVFLQTIPILAIVPLIGVWFGYELNARVVVCVIIALFPMVANTLFGLQSVDKLQLELFALQKASPITVMTKLRFPAALPAIFVGLRTSAGLSVVGALVGDYFFQRGTQGIGGLLQKYSLKLWTADLFGAILVAAALGVFMFLLFGILSKLAVGRWYVAND